MNPFFDTHTHMIWGLNHGPEDQEMVLCMLSRSYDQGARRILLTPHSDEFLRASEKIHDHYRAMEAMVRRFSDVMPGLQVGLGCEVLCEKDNMAQTITHLKNGRLPTLNGTDHVLAEFFPGVSLADLWQCVFALQGAGFVPVLAHAERYSELWKTDNGHEAAWKGVYEVEQLQKAGCRIQVNTSSLHHAHPSCWKAKELIRNGKVDFLGTDAHDTYSFPPRIREELDSLKEICSQEYRDAIAFRNAEIFW